MSQVRIALIGAGFIANYHARALLQQENTEIRAICDLDENAAKKFAKKYGIREVTAEVMSLVCRDDIDAAILCTPNKFHAPYAIAFLERGKDVFIEKPMAINSREGEQITNASKKSERMIMVGHMWRFDTEVNYVRDVVQSGKIGRIVKTKGYGIHENWGPSGWFTKKELAGGGALADMGVHAIDTVRYILGDPKPKEVYAKIGTYYGDYDVDDTGIVIISWDNGTTSIIESGWWHPHTDGPEAASQLFGIKGYASVFPTKLKFKMGEHLKEFTPPMPERGEHCEQVMYTRQMHCFIDCIRTRRDPLPGLKEGQTILKIVDAAYESAETDKVVTL